MAVYKNDLGPILPSVALASWPWLVSSLPCGTLVMLVLNLTAFENKKYTTYAKIPTKKEPIRTL